MKFFTLSCSAYQGFGPLQVPPCSPLSGFKSIGHDRIPAQHMPQYKLRRIFQKRFQKPRRSGYIMVNICKKGVIDFDLIVVKPAQWQPPHICAQCCV